MRSKAPESRFQTCSANAQPKGVLVHYCGRGFESHSCQKILKLFRETVEYIGAIFNVEEDNKLVETLIKNQNVIRSYCYCYFVFC